ncbi:hypothetical protein [Vibrio sp. F74]|uniref:hypothetical protein n=1 Tax=Vibrio sp. F74 TaxID=700020 RepID=UPI0035F552E3
MIRLFTLLLSLVISSNAMASSGITGTVYRYLKEELFGTVTHESVGFFGSLDKFVKKNDVRFADADNSVPIKFTDLGQYDLGLYFPNKGYVYLSNYDNIKLPAKYVAVTFKDKKGKKALYRYVNIPKTNQPVIISALPTVTSQQKQKKQFPLKVFTYPSNATVKIMNITPKYKEGMILRDGKYLIQVSKKGYATYSKKLNLSWNEPNVHVALAKKS